MSLPKTAAGKWSLALIVAMPISFFVGTLLTSALYKSVPAGNTILEDVAGRPVLVLAMLAGMTCGFFAFLTGLLAIVKQKERALLVYIATALGAVFIMFLLGEIVFPH